MQPKPSIHSSYWIRWDYAWVETVQDHFLSWNGPSFIITRHRENVLSQRGQEVEVAKHIVPREILGEGMKTVPRPPNALLEMSRYIIKSFSVLWWLRHLSCCEGPLSGYWIAYDCTWAHTVSAQVREEQLPLSTHLMGRNSMIIFPRAILCLLLTIFSPQSHLQDGQEFLMTAVTLLNLPLSFMPPWSVFGPYLLSQLWTALHSRLAEMPNFAWWLGDLCTSIAAQAFVFPLQGLLIPFPACVAQCVIVLSMLGLCRAAQESIQKVSLVSSPELSSDYFLVSTNVAQL